MALTKIAFNPGINKEGTEYSADSGWFDGDKIRFRKGRVETIGGWTKYIPTAIQGIARSLFDWGSAAGDKYLGVGTNLKFYVESGGIISDITPLRETTSAGDVSFAATNGSSTLVVADNSHGAVEGDFVTFSGAASLGGNITAAVLNQEYQISLILNSNTYNVTAKDTSGATVTANSSDTGNGGSSVVGAYQINTGTNFYVDSTGWGVGGWGIPAFGQSVDLTVSNQLRLYSQDAFADDLVFNPRAGGVYFWDESSGASTRAVPLSSLGGASNTPTAALQVMVSDIDRHVICFGCNALGSANIDPLLIRWSDQESVADWTPTATNSSGGQVLSTGTTIVGAVKTRQEILVFTDVGIQAMRFIGAPFVYSFSPVAENVSIISPKAGIAAADAVFFMDREGFYVYRGAVQRLPCSVLDYVFSNLQFDQRFKIYATTNPDDSEVTWYYPVGSASADITNYVTYNYLEDNWSIGTLDRGAFIHAPTKEFPVAASNDLTDVNNNYLYTHEFGHSADGEPLNAFVASGGIGLGDGESFMAVRRVIPDFTFRGTTSAADLSMEIRGKDFPLNTETVLDTAEINSTTSQYHLRARTREVIIKINTQGADYGWTLGDLRFDIKSDGRR
nr:constituent protein [uncultured Mediterranean phage uvMED]